MASSTKKESLIHKVGTTVHSINRQLKFQNFLKSFLNRQSTMKINQAVKTLLGLGNMWQKYYIFELIKTHP